ncbi:MAG: DNA adenine methylase [Alphaproteobacteria bacterium]|nr:DNA adenine methylase [Alphaproteobacteria bacterium]
MHDVFVKSPLNYIGGKHKILKQIIPLFPQNINCFIDLFAGGGNVGLNVEAKKIILNDNLVYLIDFYKELQNNSKQSVLKHIHKRINHYNLSLTNEDGYKALRTHYNQTKNPLDLFVLVSYSFNHQIRFNNNHEFNNPFGKERSCYNPSTESNLKDFIDKLQDNNIELYSKNFEDFDLSFLGKNDFVYCDPPYLITLGTYNDGKRGFTGWSEREERALLYKLDKLNKQNTHFALSNVLEHKGKKNDLLEQWLRANSNYIVNDIAMNYSNSNYQTKIRNKQATKEVLITNYMPKKHLFENELPLFKNTKDCCDEVYWEQRKSA